MIQGGGSREISCSLALWFYSADTSYSELQIISVRLYGSLCDTLVCVCERERDKFVDNQIE